MHQQNFNLHLIFVGAEYFPRIWVVDLKMYYMWKGIFYPQRFTRYQTTP